MNTNRIRSSALLFLAILSPSAADAATVEWTRQLGTSSYDVSRGISTDGLGNVYITGYTRGSLVISSGPQEDAYVSKYNASGNLLWTKQLGTGFKNRSVGVSADRQGNVYIAGYTDGDLDGSNAGTTDAFISKYDANGLIQWTRQQGTGTFDYNLGVSADGMGNVYAAGSTFGSLGGSNAGGADPFVAKYDAEGDLKWTKQLGASDQDAARSISADRLGNVFIGGETRGTLGDSSAGGDFDGFVAKYDATGSLLWTTQWGTNGSDWITAVSSDGQGNVYASGYTSGSLDGESVGNLDAFFSKLDGDGVVLWTRQLGSVLDDRSYGISSDGLGNVYISGYTSGSLDGTNAGDDDAFVSKYDASGSLQWTIQTGTGAEDRSYGVSADDLGNVYFTGSTEGSLGGTNAGDSDIFIAKVVPEPSTLLLANCAMLSLFVCGRRRQAR